MYVIIENHFIKNNCFNHFMELAEEIIEYCRNVKGCLTYNVFERKSVENQAIMISYWDKVQQYVQYLKTQKSIYLKNRLQTTLKRAPHVDLYYSLSSASGARAHHFRRVSLNNKAQNNIYNTTHSHYPYGAGKSENIGNEADENLNDSQFFIHLSQRYINISTSSGLLMRMREEEAERKRQEMMEERRRQYREHLIKSGRLNVKAEI